MNPEAPSSSSRPAGSIPPNRFVPRPEGVGAKFLARGAAADVWLIDVALEPLRPTGPPTKVVSKYVRISPEDSMIFYRRGPSNQGTKDLLWKKFVEDYQSQVGRWRSIRHENVVKILKFEEAEGLNRREEFCANGTVRDRRWPAGLGVYDMIHSAVTGLRHLHELEPPVIHGSLNAGKIYIGDDNSVKLGGFGLAILAQGFATLAPTVELTGICRWMSPELFEDGHDMILTWASDIWALGCTLYEVITGNLPYSDCKHDIEVVRRIKRGTPPGRQDEQEGSDLLYLWPAIEICWTPSPEGRPSAYEVLKEIEILTLREQVKGLSHDTQITADEDAPFMDQLNTWVEQLELEIDWDTNRNASTRGWTAIPIIQTVRLTAFAGTGATRAAAENDAAEKILDAGILRTIFEGPRTGRSQ